MAKLKLTRDEVRALPIGQLVVLDFETAKAADSARVTLHQMKRLEGMAFEKKRSSDPRIIIVKRIK